MKYSILFFSFLCLCITFYSHGQSLEDSTTIDQIIILGNRKTKPQVILNELGIKKGQKIPNSAMEKSLETASKRLINTQLFQSASIMEDPLSPGVSDLIIRVKERWYIYPLPIFSLGDRNFNDWIENQGASFQRVNFGLNLRHQNFRGYNEKVNLILQFGFTHRYKLSYYKPYLNKKGNLSLDTDIEYQNRRNIAYQTVDRRQVFIEGENRRLLQSFKASVGLNLRKDLDTKHGVYIFGEHVQVQDTIISLNPNFLSGNNRQMKYFGINYNFQKDKRDIRYYPISGYFLLLSASQSGIGIFNELSQTEISGQLKKYFKINQSYSYSFELGGYYTFQHDQPYYLRKGIGFNPLIMRGFEKYVVQGPTQALLKNDFRWLLLSKSFQQDYVDLYEFEDFFFDLYFKIIFDVGYVQAFEGEKSDLNDKILYSGGVGVDFVTWYDIVIGTAVTYNSLSEFNWSLNVKASF